MNGFVIKYVSQEEKGKKFLVEAVKNHEIYALKWDDLFRVFDIKHKHLIDKLEFKNLILDEFTEKGLMGVDEVLAESEKVERLTKIART